jgi:predicted TIM-barrel fold metal-dependent hydrolase
VFDQTTSLRQEILSDIGLARPRSAQSAAGFKLPEGLQVVSADNHCEVTEDIFYANFPARLKEKAPRVWFDRYWHIGFPNGQQAFGESERIAELLENIFVRNGFDASVRNAHMDAEGVRKEVVFPQSLLGLTRLKDLEVRELMFRVYNEYVARIGAENPGRFYGVGICSNWWDEARMEGAIQQIVDLGLKTYMVPIALKDSDGRGISYASEQMEGFWSMAEAAGLPVNFHVGEDPSVEGRGGFGSNYMTATGPFRKPLGELIFGGVFDRHPNLKVVFSEGQIYWVAGFLQDAEHCYDALYNVFDVKIKHRPTHYWQNNCYATFMADRLGFELLNYIGADRVMWSSDYPHSESVFGIGWSAMQDVAKRTTEKQARDILGDTARKLYKL